MPSAGSKPLDRSIVEGPLARAVWMLAWPTMLQNLIGGLQGVVDHALVGHFVGYAGNAAIGVAIQIFIVVIVFVISVFSGMGVLVARFAGANDPDKVNRTVYQAFLAAVALWGLLLAPLGWVLAPSLLGVVNAAPAVRVEALPFLRIMFVGSLGMLLFFMVSGALRAAGDARTPLRLGILLTVLNIACNVAFITGLGPLPRLGTAGAAVGTTVAGLVMSGTAVYLLLSGDRKSTRLNSSHTVISYAVFCLKKKTILLPVDAHRSLQHEMKTLEATFAQTTAGRPKCSMRLPPPCPSRSRSSCGHAQT